MTELAKNFKAPPVYIEGNSYEEYKKDLEIWQLLKVATLEEEGPLIYRTLTGRAKAACKHLTTQTIGSREGLKEIKKCLDAIYLADANKRVFIALDNFEKFKRSPNMTMTDFILNFENLHGEVINHNCTYPDGALAYRLMKSANVSSEHERFCKATIETGKWSYKAVSEQLMKIFSEIPSSGNSNETAYQPIKLENTFLTTNEIPREISRDHEEHFHLNENKIEVSEEISQPMSQEILDSMRCDYDIYYGNKYNQNRFSNNNNYQQSNKFSNYRKPQFQSPRGY